MEFSKQELIWLIKTQENQLNQEQEEFWNEIKVEPKIWKCENNSYWIVGLINSYVIYYNDIEEGFNLSEYSIIGIIDENFCNQDDLNTVIERTNIAISINQN